MTQVLSRFWLAQRRFRNLFLLAGVGLSCFTLWMTHSLLFSPQITLGLIAPLSGDFAILGGKDTIAGAELAVEQANQAGGFLVGDRRYRVKLAIVDDENKPAATIRAADQLLRNHLLGWLHPKIHALISSSQSSLALPLAARLQSLNPSLNLSLNPILITSATDPAVTGQKKNVVGIGLDHYTQGSLLATFAQQTLKAQRAGVLYNPDNYYSRNVVTTFQNTLEQLGGKVVITATYRGDSAQDLGSQWQAIALQKPDVLLLPNYLPDIINQGQQLKKLGQNLDPKLALNMPILGGDSWAGLISANLPLLEGGFFLSPWHPLIPDRQNQKFIQDYTKAYRQPPRTNAALAYDAVVMILRAIASQQSPNPEAIFRGIKEPFTGVTGTISNFPSSFPVRSGVITQIKNGEAEFYQQISP